MVNYKLFRLLRHNINLSTKRSPVFEQNRWAKALIYFGGALFAIYLILYGAIIGMVAEGEAATMIAFMTIILPIDFFLRFIVQQTPAMLVKPYILLPISRYTAIECFLVSGHFSGYNLLWLCMFVPYAIILLAAGASFWLVLCVVVLSELFIILNSQVYLFFRTLINRRVLWFLVAVALYALPWLPILFAKSEAKAYEKQLELLTAWGGSWWMLPLVLLLLAGLFFVNRHFQFKYVYEEISRKQAHALHHVSQFSSLERFGIVGEYLKLELKSNMRNKVMRQRCIMSIGIVIVFSLLIAYTDIYNGAFFTNFWCVYCYAIYGATGLVKIMGQEGNYIDALMVHRESIQPLLKAKFWFYSAVLILPFLLMLPAVFTGKFTLLMLVSFMLFTAGFSHFLLFQLAVYNKQTLPLEQQITGKGNFENGIQIVLEMVVFFAPGLLVAIGYFLAGPTITYIILGLIGLAFIVTHPLWIRNIYKRFMVRRYDNIEGFHDTRQ